MCQVLFEVGKPKIDCRFSRAFRTGILITLIFLSSISKCLLEYWGSPEKLNQCKQCGALMDVRMYLCMGRGRMREIDFKELAQNCAGWQAQNLQGRRTGWRLRKELQFESEVSLLAELTLGGSQYFS